MNDERRCSDCKFDKEDDTFPNCKMCLDGGSGFEPKDKENCDVCMFSWSLSVTKLQTACTNLKQELKALHDKNVELERQLKEAKQIRFIIVEVDCFDADEFLNTKDIFHHPRIMDRKDINSYEVAELMAEFTNLQLNANEVQARFEAEQEEQE